MNEAHKSWTGHIHWTEHADLNAVLQQLCKTFNKAPFFAHNGMQMRVVDGQVEGYIEMQPCLVGNLAFQILHGGVAATLLDSVGGVAAMAELYRHATADDLAEVIKKVTRMATVDIRVDYLAPGRGQFFVARAEVLRRGRKGCTMRMTMLNDENLAIATAIATYAF